MQNRKWQRKYCEKGKLQVRKEKSVNTFMHVQVHYILVGRQPAAHRWRKEKERVGAHTCVHFSISFQRWLCASCSSSTAIHRRRYVRWNGSLWSSYSLLLHMWRIWKRRRRSYGHRRLPLSTSSFISLFLIFDVIFFLSLLFFLRSSEVRPLRQMKNELSRTIEFMCFCVICVFASIA